MSVVKVKTAELIGASPDWAVAKATGASVRVLPQDNPEERWQVQRTGFPGGPYWPSSNWSQGGPLIDKHDIYFDRYPCDEVGRVVARIGANYDPRSSSEHPSSPNRLIAACRAIVAAKLGDTVEVPKELMP